MSYEDWESYEQHVAQVPLGDDCFNPRCSRCEVMTPEIHGECLERAEPSGFYRECFFADGRRVFHWEE